MVARLISLVFGEDLVRRSIVVAVVVLFAYVAVRLTNSARVATSRSPSASATATPPSATATPSVASTPSVSDNASIARAFANHARDIRVDGDGVVSRELPDDNQGDRHQRFLVRLPSGQSILIVHNIDIAPRVANLRVGDEIQFEGEFVWNDKGGLVHWTHHDPAGRHRAGWLKYGGRTYQ